MSYTNGWIRTASRAVRCPPSRRSSCTVISGPPFRSRGRGARAPPPAPTRVPRTSDDQYRIRGTGRAGTSAHGGDEHREAERDVERHTRLGQGGRDHVAVPAEVPEVPDPRCPV